MSKIIAQTNSYRKYSIDNSLSENQKQKIIIIRETYRKQRKNINYSFNQYLIKKYCFFDKKEDFWNLFSKLDDIVDLSDPDTSLPNSIHALQTAEAIRKDNHPDWMVLCGLIHDFGKIIYINGCDEDGTSKTTQWSIVGDTFITGTRIPDEIVLSEFNEENFDHKNKVNLYINNCGLDSCSVSFGHDEYMYRLLIANNHSLPREAEYIIRYHSLYAWHNTKNSYEHLESDDDIKYKEIVKTFNKYDLYSKDDDNIIKWTPELKEYYSSLVKKYISENLIINY